MDRLHNVRHWIPWVYLVIVCAAAVSSALLLLRQQDQNSRIRHNQKTIAHLVRENQGRIHDNRSLLIRIQRSRVVNCEKTYGTMQKILTLSAKGRSLTPIQRKRFQALLDLADPKKCLTQTKPKPPVNP